MFEIGRVHGTRSETAASVLAAWCVKRDPLLSSFTLSLPTMSNDVTQIVFAPRNVVDALRDFMTSDSAVAEHQNLPVIDILKLLGLVPCIKFRRSRFCGARIRVGGQPIPQPGGGPPAYGPVNALQFFLPGHCMMMGSRTVEGGPLAGHICRLEHNRLLPDRQIVLREIRSTNCVMSCSLPFGIDMEKLDAKNGMTSVQQHDSFPGVMLEHYDSPESDEQAQRDLWLGHAESPRHSRAALEPSAHRIDNLSCLVFSSGEIILMGLVVEQKDTIYSWFRARLGKWAACRCAPGSQPRSKQESIKAVRDWLIGEAEAGRTDLEISKIKAVHYMQVVNMWTQLRRQQRAK